MDPPAGFRRAHAGVRPGTWSDDGAQLLCLASSLLHCDRLDVDDLGRRLVNWYEHGYCAVDGHVFDVGIQTRRALVAIRSGVPTMQAAPRDERSNGNGSLMRVLPLALWHRGDDASLVEDAMAQSSVTHAHPRSRVCCALYVLWARRALEGHADAWERATAALRALLPRDCEERAELETHVRPDDPAPGTGSGYVVDTLRSARSVLLGETEYERVVRAAISLGDDTDTTACVAGGIAGIAVGVDGIPRRWRDALRGMELVSPVLDALIARAEH